MRQFFLLILFLGTVLSLQAQSSTWYVKAGAPISGTGLTWENAFTDLHDALNIAQAGDQIWVAAGKYLPDTSTNRNHPFVLPSGVRLYGGFQGAETNIAQRVLGAHPTILSGDIGVAADSTDNAYTILYMEYPDSTTLVSGFTLEGGYAVSDTSYFNGSRILSGAAVYILAKDSIALPTFDHCTFRNNLAQSYGGAIYVSAVHPKGSWPTFRYCDFIYNTAYFYDGGAVYMPGGNLYDHNREFDHCRFIHNRAGRWGGGIHIEKSVGQGTLDLFACVAEDNSAPFVAGFLSYLSSNILLRSVLIDSCRLAKNYSEHGAPAIYFFSFEEVRSMFGLRNSEITNHTSSNNSNYSIIVMESSADMDSIYVVNNYFHDNNDFGLCGIYSGLYAEMSGNIVLNNGGSIGANAPYCYFKNNIIANNHLSAGGSSGSIESVVCNNLFYKNGNSEMAYSNFAGHAFNNTFIDNFYKDDQNPDLHPAYAFNLNYNNIYQGNINIFDGQVGIPMQISRDSNYFAYNIMDVDCNGLGTRSICGPGNIITTNPQFIDAAAKDYRLSPCSPGVDAGWNALPDTFHITTALNGLPRKINGLVDIGAFESPAFALSQLPVVQAACNGFSDGSISFVITNGCSLYQVAWASGSSESLTINDLPAGNYQFSITDSQGQQIISTLEVPASAINVVPHIQKASSATAMDASILVEVIFGVAPYDFIWNNGDTTSSITNLIPGSYQLTVTDAAGCSFTAQYEVGFTVASQEAQSSVDVQISPNPADKETTILLAESGLWQLYSSTGILARKVELAANSKTVVNLDDLPAGIYQYVVYQSSHSIHTGRLVVVHH